MERRRLTAPAGLLMLLVSAAVTQAQFGGFRGGDDDDNDDNNPFSNGGFGPSSDDMDSVRRQWMAHGVLGALAFVILFPTGSIMMRVLPGRAALWGHAIAQTLTYCVFISSAVIGIRLVDQMQIPGTNNFVFTNSSVNYHPIIGLVVLAALFFQPILGIIHHKRFKRVKRRQAWSYMHLFNGRVFIILGIINGGLGLKIARESTGLKVAYAVVAAIMGSLWMLAAFFGEFRVWRVRRAARGSGPPDDSEVATGPAAPVGARGMADHPHQGHFAKPEQGVTPPRYE